MSVNFNESQTRLNLMRAFAGESQARNRYTIAASKAKSQKLHVVEAVFTFTANQEKEHAEIFYNHLKSLAPSSLTIEGGYPVEAGLAAAELLQLAQHNEYEEYNNVYKNFAKVADEEGYPEAAFSFKNIAEIEKIHGDRFGELANLLKEGKLFVADTETKWMCLNCGYVFSGKEVPPQCPVCSHDRGYFIRLALAPYTALT